MFTTLRWLATFVCLSVLALPLSSQDATLQVEVRPEVRLNVSNDRLRLIIPPDVTGPISSDVITLTAWARPGPGQNVRLIMRSDSDLTGDGASIAVSEMRWTGSKTASRAGGATALCTSGMLRKSAVTDLVANWNRGGIVTCAVSFTLADPSRFHPGTYSAGLQFELNLN